VGLGRGAYKYFAMVIICLFEPHLRAQRDVPTEADPKKHAMSIGANNQKDPRVH